MLRRQPLWEGIIQDIRKWTYDAAEKLSKQYTAECNPSDIGKSVSYYFEEVIAVAGTPIEYDPIFSLPRGKIFI